MYIFTIFTHIQRAIINQPECSRGFMFGFGLESSFCLRCPSVTPAPDLGGAAKKNKKKIDDFLSRRWQKHMTRLQLERSTFSDAVILEKRAGEHVTDQVPVSC